MPEKQEITDSELNAHTHKTEIKNLIKRVDDFETRVRSLEKYKSEREGFARANLHWIGYITLIMIQVIILFFKDWMSN